MRDQGARKIGRGFQSLAHVGARGAVVDESRDGVEPVGDLVRIGERRGQPLRQEPRAGRRDSAVDGGQQRTAAFAGQCAQSSRLLRVAWSIASVAPAASATGGDSGGRLPIWVRST